MSDGQSIDAAAPKGDSLIARITAAAARLRSTRSDRGERAWLIPALSLIVWIPLALWAGGRWLEQGVRADLIARQLANRPAAMTRAVADAEHRALAAMIARPAAAQTIEQLAVALPAEDRLIAVETARDGVVSIEVSTVDPARLRSALRVNSHTGSFRTLSERREDAGFRVTLRQEQR